MNERRGIVSVTRRYTFQGFGFEQAVWQRYQCLSAWRACLLRAEDGKPYLCQPRYDYTLSQKLVRMWLSLSLPHWSSTVTYMIRSLSIPLNAYFFHCEGCPIYTIRTGSPNWWRFVIDCDDPSPLISSQHACRRSSVVLYTYNECHHEPSPLLKYCYTSLACLFLSFAGRRDPLQTVTPLFAVTLKSLFHDFAV